MKRANPQGIYHCGTHATRILNTIPLEPSTDIGSLSHQYVHSFWYDWFCSKDTLHRRGLRLLRALRSIRNSPRFDRANMAVWFKNNCPMTGSTYDDMRISDLKTNQNAFVIVVPSNRYGKPHPWEVFVPENGYKTPVVSGDWKTIRKWFMEEPLTLDLVGPGKFGITE